MPLAEARSEFLGTPGGTAKPTSSPDQRQFPRMAAKGRKLQLLIDGSPTNFALHDISEGGARGDTALDLSPGAGVYVRFDGGILVPAMVKWAEDGLVGLAFVTPVMLDRSGQGN